MACPPTRGAQCASPHAPHLGGQLRAPAAFPAALPRGSATAGSWHLHPLRHQNGRAVVKAVIWHAWCQGIARPALSPRDGVRTNSKAPWVEGVPGEVGHRRTVLDGGHSRIGEAARLGELGERARGSPVLCPPAPCQPPRCAGGTSRTAIWPPAESRGRAMRWWLAQKPSHSPGVVRLSPRRLVRWVSRCSTLPCVCRKRELGPGAGGGRVSAPGRPPLAWPQLGDAEPTPPPAHPKCSAVTSGWGCWRSRWRGRCRPRGRWRCYLARPVRTVRSSHCPPMGERAGGQGVWCPSPPVPCGTRAAGSPDPLAPLAWSPAPRAHAPVGVGIGRAGVGCL